MESPQPSLWYKDAVIYQLHVKAYADGDGDGIGDFAGLIEKLPYIKSLGATAIWLLPFYPSPLRDDGYDIAEYKGVNPSYGTLRDVRTFIKAAHKLGLKIITELVVNHTSDQHPWFQRARKAPRDSAHRKFYVWNDSPETYAGTRIIFTDTETSNWQWDPVAGQYYWHRFFSHQPDLNFDHPPVFDAISDVMRFWFGIGVDGMRLDAVPYLCEREGTSSENLPETHAVLKRLRAIVDAEFPDRLLLAEANQWPEDVSAYFGDGDECQMAFHFPLMPRMFMSIAEEDRYPLYDIMRQTPQIPPNCQWAIFLRNHDELTLEMVTDDERDYLYDEYAKDRIARLNLGIRRRLAPLLENDRRRIELMNGMLMSLPGTPIIYYGDEIGMGDNFHLGDRDGVRTPMQWSADKNAGFSRANPQSLYLPINLDPENHYEAVNVEVQLGNPHSLLWWMRRMLALRKRWRALGEGKCEFLQTENRKVLSYILRYKNETLLVVANLSRFCQPLEMDLSAFQNMALIELFGRTEFPMITDRPYFVSLGPHSFYWFSIEPKFARVQAPAADAPVKLPVLAVSHHWTEILEESYSFSLKEILPDYFQTQPWFKGRSRTVKLIAIKENIPVKMASGAEARLAFLEVDYLDGDVDLYSVPLAFAAGAEAEDLRQHAPQQIIAELKVSGSDQAGILYDAFGSGEFCTALLEVIRRPRRLKGARGEIEVLRMAALRKIIGDAPSLKPSAVRNEQSNSCVAFEDKLMFKLFRRLEPGINPELEIGRFLNSHEFPYCRTVAGGLEYLGAAGVHYSLAVVHAFIPSASNAWDFTLDSIGRYYDRVVTWVAQGESAAVPLATPMQLLQPDFPAEVGETIGTYLESARLLGVRTAELHRVLASDTVNPAFAPEPSTSHHRRSVFQSMRNTASQNLRGLRQQKDLPPEIAPLAQKVAELEPAILDSYRALANQRLAGQRLRLHGDCRLSEVLWTGKDFVFIDFEGDPTLPISERRLKRSPIRDVATMLRSFHYAAAFGLEQHIKRGSIPPENMVRFQSWLRYWNMWVSAVFLKAYFQAIAGAHIVPEEEEAVRAMLRAYLLDCMMSELGRQGKEGRERLDVPLSGVLFLLRVPLPQLPAAKRPQPQSVF